MIFFIGVCALTAHGGAARRIWGWTMTEWREYMSGFSNLDWAIYCHDGGRSAHSVTEWWVFFQAQSEEWTSEVWLEWWLDDSNW